MPYVKINRDILQEEEVSDRTNLEKREWSFCKHLIELEYREYDEDEDYYSEISYRESTLINSTLSLKDYDDRLDGMYIRRCSLDNVQLNELIIDTNNHTERLRILVKKSSERTDITSSIRKIIISKRVELRIYDYTGTMKDIPIEYIGDGSLSTLTIEEGN